MSEPEQPQQPQGPEQPKIRGQGRRAWDQQSDEPTKVFVLFQAYLHMGVEWSVPKVWEKVLHNSIPLSGLRKIAQAFSWQFRADQYDLWVAKNRQNAFEAAQEKRSVNEAQAVNLLAQVALLSVQRTLWRLSREKAFGPKRDSHGKVMADEKARS